MGIKGRMSPEGDPRSWLEMMPEADKIIEAGTYLTKVISRVRIGLPEENDKEILIKGYRCFEMIREIRISQGNPPVTQELLERAEEEFGQSRRSGEDIGFYIGRAYYADPERACQDISLALERLEER